MPFWQYVLSMHLFKAKTFTTDLVTNKENVISSRIINVCIQNVMHNAILHKLCKMVKDGNVKKSIKSNRKPKG